MKLIHTADWHLGRALYGRKRYDEQGAFLDWLLATLSAEHADALIIAGDIFDSGNPPNRAQALYYDFLCRAAATTCRHIIITAGNHDSPTFLDAPRELLRALNIHIIGSAGSPADETLLLRAPDGSVEAICCAVPYLRERDIRSVDAGESSDDKARKLLEGIRAHYAATIAHAETLRATHSADIPLIATGHLFAAGGSTTDGDGTRDLYIGSLAHVPADAFPAAIDYLALGHLHRPQTVGGDPTRRYSGAPLAFGFGEAGQEKSLTLVTFAGRRPYIDTLAIPCWQTLARIHGDWPTIENRLHDLAASTAPVWLEIEYDGAEHIADLRERLQQRTGGTLLDILRIKNNRITARVLAQNHAAERLDDLDPNDVFSRCLDAHNIPAEQRPDLLAAYRQILTDIQEADNNAE